jgi:KUP system potassium uptake protein
MSTPAGPGAATHQSHASHAALPVAASGWKLALTALGVVYGDIGTSPLYALRECVKLPHGVAPTHENINGLLSLFFWSLTLVVVVKYLVFLLRMDNNGEGGVMALLALVTPQGTKDSDDEKRAPRGRWLLAGFGLFGAALLCGDGVITPAISVLSAVEGLEVATTSLAPVVVPITLVILFFLFRMQRYGTAGIGAVFGPAMALWFVALAATGLPWIFRRPEILLALSPHHAVRFFAHHGLHGFLVLGSVVLCVTGGEALYADMGHFGRGPIQKAWFWAVFPALLISYFGQGALLLERPEAASSPFFSLVEGPYLLYPLVLIATIATIVASQALITGVYSLTQQAMQLGYCPRLTIHHTSDKTEGQIYMPEINSMLMVGCLAIVIAFKSSTELAAAYGIAVTGAMMFTSVLFFEAARLRWRWRGPAAGALVVLFLCFDLAFFGANLAKVAHGGWVPLAIAVGVFAIMTTWKKGRTILAQHVYERMLPLKDFVASAADDKVHRVKGTAVFMASNRRGTPGSLLHHFKHNKVLHEKVVVLTIVNDHVPQVPRAERVRYKDLGHGFWAVTAHYGFRETPKVSEILRLCRQRGLEIKDAQVSFFLGREVLVADPGARRMSAWRRSLFSFLTRNARAATDFFGLPPNQVVELGTQIEL